MTTDEGRDEIEREAHAEAHPEAEGPVEWRGEDRWAHFGSPDLGPPAKQQHATGAWVSRSAVRAQK